MLETAVFLVLSLCLAVLLWFARPAGGEERLLGWVRALILILMPVLAFTAAYLNHNGAQLTTRLTQMRVPQSAVAATPATADGYADFLIVGDRPETSDLVVTPFADQSLSKISMPADPRRFVTVRAKAPPATAPAGTAMDVQLLFQSHAPEPAMELPGMGVAIGEEDAAMERIAPGDPVSRAIAPGDKLYVTIERIDPEGHAARRSFWIELRAGPVPAVELTLKQPLAAAAGSCAAPRLRLSPMTSSDAREPLFRDPENLTFSALGQGERNPVVEPRWLGPLAESAFLCARSETRFTWPASVDAADARLKLVAQKTFLPWYACIFAVLCILAIHMLCIPGWRAPGAERVVVPLLQWLLTLRLLIAVSGLYNSSSLSAWAVLSDGMAALLCLPILAVIALRPGGRELRPLMIAMALLVAIALVAMRVSLEALSWRGIPAVLCYVTLAAAAARAWKHQGDAPLALACDRLAGFAGTVEAEADAPPRPALFGQPRAVAIGAGIVIAMIVMRMVLAGIGGVTHWGLTERLFGLPLSMVYVPAVPLGFALLLDGMRHSPRTPWDLPLVFLLFIGAYWVVPAFTRDFGLIFVSGWPLAMVIAWYGARHLSPSGSRIIRSFWWSAPALPVAFVAVWGVYIAFFSTIPTPGSDLGAHMAEVVEWSRNGVRMLAFLAPERVDALGTKYAFESLDLITSIQPLTHDLIGQGYLTPSNVGRSLLDNQYSDNLSAVHIMWPWGRLGAVALLAVILAGISALRTAPAPEGETSPPDWRALTGIMAGVTFAWAAIYMIMANLNWVPFTGRNIYLLAATSGGDLVEGLMLVLMTALPLACATARAAAAAEGR